MKRQSIGEEVADFPGGSDSTDRVDLEIDVDCTAGAFRTTLPLAFRTAAGKSVRVYADHKKARCQG